MIKLTVALLIAFISGIIVIILANGMTSTDVIILAIILIIVSSLCITVFQYINFKKDKETIDG